MNETQRHKFYSTRLWTLHTALQMKITRANPPWPQSPWDMQRDKRVHPWGGEETQQQLDKDKRCEESSPRNGEVEQRWGQRPLWWDREWGLAEISRKGISMQQEQYPWRGAGGTPWGLVRPYSLIWGPGTHVHFVKIHLQYTNECAVLSRMVNFSKNGLSPLGNCSGFCLKKGPRQV